MSKCVKCAKEKNLNVIALLEGGHCTGAVDDGAGYKKYGSSDACNFVDGLGGTNANYAFRLSE